MEGRVSTCVIQIGKTVTLGKLDHGLKRMSQCLSPYQEETMPGKMTVSLLFRKILEC